MSQALSHIPVLYRAEMVAPEASATSPSAGKPAQVVADWQSLGLPIAVASFEPLDVDTLALAHDRAFVEGVLEGRLANGFGNRKPQVSASLPFTNGAMLAAARTALDNGQVPRYLKRLPGIVGTFHDCDLLLYQAGADAHVDDPLGGWMTSEQLAERDRIVFQVAARIGLPVAWNLAGGYQRDAQGGIEPVLAIHRRTMRACVEEFVR